MRTILLAITISAAVLGANHARADVDVRVGSGANCATASIQTAINGASAANGVTNILIARNAIYNTNWLNITSKNVRLIGGYADCGQAVRDDIRTTIDGAGGGQDSVIKVRGATSNVGFFNLNIVGGDAVSASGRNGGGVEIEDGPHNLVYFDNVWIANNQATEGGGLWIKNENSGNANDVIVWLSHNTRIYSNAAVQSFAGASGDGGGVFCFNATVYMTGGVSDLIGSHISSNSAAGAGGGLRVENCKMYIASRHIALGTIDHNTSAGPGGGISVSGERAEINLYTQVPNQPTLIDNNVAGGVGGAIDIGSSAHVIAWDIIVSNNISRSGGGAVSVFDNDDSPNAYFKMKGTLVGAPADPPGNRIGTAVNCASSQHCNRISSNLAIESGGTRRPGAAIRASATNDIGVAADVFIEGTEIIANSGENLVELAGEGARVTINGAAIFNNNVTAELMHAPFDLGHLSVLWSTIAGNTIGAAATFRSSMNGTAGTSLGTQFKNSIHWQPGKRIYSVVNGTVNGNNTDFVLANDLTGLPASTHNLVADPLFTDPATQDYRLELGSPAVDYSAVDASAPTADHLPRVIDLMGPGNDNFGIQDLGAYERQFACAADTIFCNGFER